MRKILYSPGYGAGWTSWEGDTELKKFMLEYRPFIDFLENGGTGTDLLNGNRYHRCEFVKYYGDKKVFDEEVAKKEHPLLSEFAKECFNRFGTVPYMGGLDDIAVEEVSGPIRIEEYDGYESVVRSYEDWM
jgi:hypothetical protein